MKQRVISALIAAPIVLALVFARNTLPIYALSLVCIFLACDELAWMVYRCKTWIPHFCTVIFAGSAWVLRDLYQDHRERIVWALGSLVLGAVVWMWAELKGGERRRLLIPGLIWIMAPVMGLLCLHYSVPKVSPDFWWPDPLARFPKIDAMLPPDFWWPNPLLMALIPIWVGDTVAIIVGKWVGKTPLWPALSPKKTWEGAVANLAGCIFAASTLAPAIGLTWKQGIMVGLISGVLGQYGDLFESAIKRVFDTKDSGWIMPGHGGILDRMDSILLPALPITALILFYR